MALLRLALDAVDREALRLDRRDGRIRFRLRFQRKLVELLAAEMRQSRIEGSAGRTQVRVYRPIFLRPEGFDLLFSFAYKAQRDGLNPARGTRARQLAPQHGREREADEIVERAPRHIGVDEFFVDLAR